MKKVFSSDNQLTAGQILGLIESENIPCIIKNQNLSSAMGEIPPIECWQEVWILDDDFYDRAMDLIRMWQSTTPGNYEPWDCVCGEHLEGQFTSCWSCGRDAPRK